MYTMSRAEAGAATTAIRRERLNRDRVQEAAVALADESGIGAVSMRGLARELGVVPMALYKHVADKDELLDGMVDVIIGEFADADLGQDWKDRVRQRILGARRTVLRHPWARPAIESRTNRTPAVLGYMDSVAGEFRAGGLSADLTHHVMHALGNRIWGFSPELFDESRPDDPNASKDQPPPDPQAQEAMAREFAARFPNILAIALAATEGDLSRVGGGCDEQFEFEFALDLLLDGAERLHRQGWRSSEQVVNANKPKSN
jgi:AcrR family transcriptional regulator